MSDPTFEHETRAIARGAIHVAGVDEVGRGPLAGPVTAAAVILDPQAIPEGLRDSKKLSPHRRASLAQQLRQCARISIAHASVEEIDRINILQASMLAMVRAVDGLGQKPDHVLVDGNRIPEPLRPNAEAIVKGDARCLSIAAASIIAKVARDDIMVDLAQHFPGYGWDRNAGYGTREHLEALNSLGVTPYHRRSFKPVYNML